MLCLFTCPLIWQWVPSLNWIKSSTPELLSILSLIFWQTSTRCPLFVPVCFRRICTVYGNTINVSMNNCLHSFPWDANLLRFSWWLLKMFLYCLNISWCSDGNFPPIITFIVIFHSASIPTFFYNVRYAFTSWNLSPRKVTFKNVFPFLNRKSMYHIHFGIKQIILVLSTAHLKMKRNLVSLKISAKTN